MYALLVRFESARLTGRFSDSCTRPVRIDNGQAGITSLDSVDLYSLKMAFTETASLKPRLACRRLWRGSQKVSRKSLRRNPDGRRRVLMTYLRPGSSTCQELLHGEFEGDLLKKLVQHLLDAASSASITAGWPWIGLWSACITHLTHIPDTKYQAQKVMERKVRVWLGGQTCGWKLSG